MVLLGAAMVLSAVGAESALRIEKEPDCSGSFLIVGG